MISTPDEMWIASQNIYQHAGTNEDRMAISLEFICGSLLSIAKSLAEINDPANSVCDVTCFRNFVMLQEKCQQAQAVQ